MRTHTITTFVLTIVIITFSLTSATAFQQKNSKFVVVLDAGHGGKDPGRPTNYGYKEKDIALKMVLAVGKLLEKDPTIKVIYTRKTDVFLELHERAKIANKADADLFVSIHCNAHNSQAHGSETYVLATRADNKNFNIAKQENEVIFLESDHETHYEGFDPNSPESLIGLSILQEEYLDQSIKLARAIEDNVKGKLKRKSRGVKQAGFWVLHNTYMPSILIETGFITNKSEGDYLNSKKGQNEVSTSISGAISAYKKSLDQNLGENIYEDTPLSIEDVIASKEIYKDVTFKVQISAISRKLAPKSYNFNGLTPIEREKVGGLYKYYFGSTSDYNEVKQLQAKAKTKGYTTCFIIAYKDGNKISVSDALKSNSN
ncbi:N-acetylmuramoyl-L-alanine amidase family protein [Lacinutrix undariae]